MNFRVFLLAVTLLLPGLSGPSAAAELKTAIFAGGCFWCVEADFDKVPGVAETISGYTGGSVANPTYKQVGRGTTGHREAVRIMYDPTQVDYETLLTVFWHSVDPVDAGGQFCDRGEPYQTAVFVADARQRAAAEQSKANAAKELGQPLVTPILDAGPFYVAEDYHQNYADKNPLTYHYYRWRCGRNDRIESLWGDSAFKGMPKS